MNNKKPAMFVLADGRNVLFTFLLVSSLFLLWGFCNGMINVIVCLLVVLKLGWLSVGCVFLSYFFMSIMFPTIFAPVIRKPS